MENEIEVYETQTTSDIMKEAALKAVTGAVIGVLATAVVTYMMDRAKKKLKNKKSETIEATATEV